MTKDEALKLALEALLINCGGNTEGIGKEAITAIKQALAAPTVQPVKPSLWEQYHAAQPAPVQEPVIAQEGDTLEIETILYTSPQRTWVGLSEEEILKLAYPIRWQEVDDFEADKAVNFAQAIEAKLKELNT